MSTCPLWFVNRITLLYMHLMITVTYNWTNIVRILTKTRHTVGKFKSVHQSDSSFMDTHLCTLRNIQYTNMLIFVFSLTNSKFKETKTFQIVIEQRIVNNYLWLEIKGHYFNWQLSFAHPMTTMSHLSIENQVGHINATFWLTRCGNQQLSHEIIYCNF
jgi:hypothetical protein